MFEGAFGSLFDFGQVIAVQAVPLLIVALGLTVLPAGVYNIGAEGQLFMGGALTEGRSR
jgi:ABC-type uncharacterized transport system permease subunit